ncbi:hypothetical protein GCM10009868_12900 [Terrabacter aerolatus]|uniref:Predicted membrane protein YciQ-like C-terminal domain-containing protein n=2 Tax=Terrabacter aerolatus TaxID=422442 RepID=A0A512CY51_9MICO|nr:DUF2207 domain-containing protein [Terrabacter aerolatus]GEO29146.1 hypothetical protein TAE01_09560 [Terrabacter aerolatus]
MHATPMAGLPGMAYAATPALVDRDTLVGASALGLVPLLLAGVVVLVKWWRGRDEMFGGVTPGLLPPDGTAGSRHRVRGGEWSGTVAPVFAPPPDVRPGVVGTVVDGVADPHDVSATLLDLAVRGWFRIVDVRTERDERPRDWELHRVGPAPAETTTAFEQLLLDRIFEARDVVRLSALKGSFGLTMREAQIGLYREVVDRGWYARHPRARNGRTRAAGLAVLVPSSLAAAVLVVAGLVDAHDWSLTPVLVGLVAALAVLARWGGARTPRTAEGTALRIQALGFREYLATAEADRLRFEEKRALLSSYLPYAVAFGLTGHFAGLLRDLAQESHWTDYVDGLDWYDFGGSGPDGDDLALGDALGDVADAATWMSDPGDLLDGVDGFTDAADSLFSFDGLTGCGDGCDLPGCDLPGCDLAGCDF